MGIENRQSTELEDLFASLVTFDGDPDKDKAKETANTDDTAATGTYCDFTTGVCMPADQANQDTASTNSPFQTVDLSKLNDNTTNQ
ncbi:hypothetical protein [Aerococcus sp. 1KP-2016]|uniref:hypothetical protein n=1 Tax=Aerococcus sp. 1KP-2016 TaxID=1981982 RepID=UPI000B97EFE4|nr:hypothetical protein [Aerococcus sp. 1KP-2016]OYQ67648.1 hypothetical protein B9P78_02855 [Aerococcus sp. 1KP-2016]